MKQAIVVAEQGTTVNMRAQPSKASPVLKQVPLGEIVDVYEEGPEWSKISYNCTDGYMMTEFTVPVADTEPPEEAPGVPPEEPGEGFVTLKLPESVAFALWEALDGVIGHG